ncbi:MAG: beta-lactamase family protein [Saprospiraceae bacterium]|nr:beta-lactamase family protein [Saprospiraceae bacterium]
MRKMSSLLFLVLFPVFSILNNTNIIDSALADVSEATTSADDWEFIAQFEEDFQRKLKISGCPGAAVAIVKNDQVLYLKGFGVQKNGHNDLVDTETLFRVGSLSKGFAGLLTSQLVEDGYLNWDDKVKDILPEFDLKDHAQANRITIQHLLSHSTGIQRHAYTDLTERGLKFERIIPSFSKLNVYGKEGEYYAYQNTAFSFIEEIIKRKTGKEYNEWLREKIFKPARMEQASMDYKSIKKSDNVALPHVFDRRHRCVSTRLNKKYYNAVSAGGVNASISDMANWLRVLLGNRQDMVKQSSLDFIFSPLVKNPQQHSFYGWGGVKSNYYGIGWRVVNWPDHSLVFHSGSVNGYHSDIAIDRKNKIGICILYSTNDRYADLVIPDFFRDYYQHQKDLKSGKKLIVDCQDKENKVIS